MIITIELRIAKKHTNFSIIPKFIGEKRPVIPRRSVEFTTLEPMMLPILTSYFFLLIELIATNNSGSEVSIAIIVDPRKVLVRSRFLESSIALSTPIFAKNITKMDANIKIKKFLISSGVKRKYVALGRIKTSIIDLRYIKKSKNKIIESFHERKEKIIRIADTIATKDEERIISFKDISDIFKPLRASKPKISVRLTISEPIRFPKLIALSPRIPEKIAIDNSGKLVEIETKTNPKISILIFRRFDNRIAESTTKPASLAAIAKDNIMSKKDINQLIRISPI